MVANGDDTNGLERSQGSAAAARWTQNKKSVETTLGETLNV